MTLPSVSLVMPAFNEERRLPRVFDILATSAADDLRAAGLELTEVVIADDGSTDETAKLLFDAAADDPRLRALPPPHGGPRGKGAALRRGILATTSQYVLLSDVDLATPLAEAAALSERLRDGADVAIGSRDLPGSTLQNAPAYRKLIGRAFNRGVRAATGLPYRDTQCGFKLMRTGIAQELARTQLVPGFAWDVELLMRAQAAGLRVDEVPVCWVHDHDSRVRVVSAGARMGADVVRLSAALRGRSRRPPGT
jgi:glycosyltransferase involved in cell wall biosynthesis